MTDGYRLAIDFGTSNTCATVRRSNQGPSSLRLGYNSNAMPSAVLVRGDEILVGDDATRLAALDPGAFERTPKRRLGQSSMLLGGREVDPVDLVAAVLRRVLGQASLQSQGAGPAAVVITHPAAWSGHLTDRLLVAAARAGIDPGRTTLLPEPLAAAWRHAADGAVAVSDELAVVDFGGGTFDVAHLRVSPGQSGLDIRVGQADGLDPLGGDDFDGLLETWVRGQLVADGRDDLLAAIAAPGALAARLTLREEITKAKHALSHHASAPILVVADAERALVTITVEEFEAMIGPSVARAVDTARRLLDGAEVDHLFLTGGTSLIPLVQREFQALSGGRVGTLGDPKEVTSLGALLVDLTPVPASTSPEATPGIGLRLPSTPPRREGERTAPATLPQPSPPAPERPSTHPVLDRPRGDRTAGDTNAAGRRRLIRTLAIVGTIAIAAILGMSVWLAGSAASPGEARNSSLVTASTAPSATSPVTPTTSDTSTTTTSSTPIDCAGLDGAQCDLVASRAGIVLPGSCTPWEGAPERHAVKCTPKRTDVAIAGAPTLYLFQFDTAAELESAAATFFSAQGVDLATLHNTDLSAPPAKDTWKFTGDAARDGAIYTHFSASENMARLMWTYDSDRVYVTLASTGGNMPNLLEWWGRV